MQLEQNKIRAHQLEHVSGDWLRAFRVWIQGNFINGSDITWGSPTPLRTSHVVNYPFLKTLVTTVVAAALNSYHEKLCLALRDKGYSDAEALINQLHATYCDTHGADTKPKEDLTKIKIPENGFVIFKNRIRHKDEWRDFRNCELLAMCSDTVNTLKTVSENDLFYAFEIEPTPGNWNWIRMVLTRRGILHRMYVEYCDGKPYEPYSIVDVEEIEKYRA